MPSAPLDCCLLACGRHEYRRASSTLHMRRFSASVPPRLGFMHFAPRTRDLLRRNSVVMPTAPGVKAFRHENEHSRRRNRW